MRRCTTSPLAMFFALPARRTGVRLRGLLKRALPAVFVVIDVRLFIGSPNKRAGASCPCAPVSQANARAENPLPVCLFHRRTLGLMMRSIMRRELRWPGHAR